MQRDHNENKHVFIVHSNNFYFVFLPHAEDLMSLLDADIHSAHPSVIIDADAMFSEDISYFGYPSFRRSSLSRLGSSRGNSAAHLLLMKERQVDFGGTGDGFSLWGWFQETKRSEIKALFKNCCVDD